MSPSEHTSAPDLMARLRASLDEARAARAARRAEKTAPEIQPASHDNRRIMSDWDELFFRTTAFPGGEPDEPRA